MPFNPYTGLWVPSLVPELGYGEPPYGFSPYGAGTFPRPPYPPGGGYGGAFGIGPYGAADIVQPRVTAAWVIDGHTLQVFFSEEMKVDAALNAPASYVLTAILGVPVTVTVVALGTAGSYGGVTSVVLTHTGTTLGGSYLVTVADTLSDVNGNLILPTTRQAAFLAVADEPVLTATAISGNTVQVDFGEDVLTEVDWSPGVEDPTSYQTSTTYPVSLTISSIDHPVSGDLSLADMTVVGMTSVSYGMVLGPATSVDFDGSYLPSAATDFQGVEYGVGSSSASVATRLLLTKSLGDVYGWSFEDTSGKMAAGTTFRFDLVIDAQAAVYSPALYDAILGTLTVSDGVIEVIISLLRVAGVGAVSVVSGAYSVQSPVPWSAARTTITFLRNMKSGHCALLMNGVPLQSAAVASFTGAASIPAGARWSLSPSYEVTAFPIRSVDLTASATLFTGAWNFIHNGSVVFIGSSALTRPSLLTARGPLVKDWGDPTPATVQDVEVRVNGVAVTISDVNPYTGMITPSVPIPLTPPGTVDVEVDYVWFRNPAIEMVGLNTLGLVLNKWNRPVGQRDSTSTVSGLQGVMDTARFPMGIVLPPLVSWQPLLIGHRFIGFEQAYSALLNSPTTLLLNRSPHAISVGDLSEDTQGVSVSFEGLTSPLTASDQWLPEGTDTGCVGEGGSYGSYVLIDASTGSYDHGSPAAYYRWEDLSFPCSVVMAARLQVTSYTLDGVFTGLCFGFHDNRRLYLVGILDINGVHHIGLLLDGTQPQEASSWQVGPAATITITSSTTFTVPEDEFFGVASWDTDVRIQILEGAQAGVYKIIDCGVRTENGLVTVTLDPSTPFPADYSLYGNNTAVIAAEILWDEALTTYRLVAVPEMGAAEIYVGGSLSGLAISTELVSAFPAQATLMLPTSEQGTMFWGSLSREAVNKSLWSLVRYGITPDLATMHFKGIVAAAEMSVLPDVDENHEWFVTQEFGHAEIRPAGPHMLLESLVGDSSIDLTYGYGRIEPFLCQKTVTDVDAKFQVDYGSWADAQVVIRDGERSVTMATLLYLEGGTPYRRLVVSSSVSLPGILIPMDAGWSPTAGIGLTPSVEEAVLVIQQDAGDGGLWETNLSNAGDLTTGRVVAARLAIRSYTPDVNGYVGPVFGAEFGTSGSSRITAVGFRMVGISPKVVLTSTGTDIASFDFDWTDGEAHTYRMIADPTVGTVSLVADDTVLGNAATGAFSAGSDWTRVFVGTLWSNAACVSAWEALSCVSAPPAAAKRTLGVLRDSSQKFDINSWELPRTDSTSAVNSSSLAIVEEMDWRSEMRVRVRLDPNWGGTVFRPDLPPPPYYTGAFATEFTEPSAGWINVEYRNLPLDEQLFGEVRFGSLDSCSVTSQRWWEVRYRIYTNSTENFIAPQGMVLNRSNVVTSGELGTDMTIETVAVEAMSATLVSLIPAHIFADRVFNLIVRDAVLPAGSWAFNKTSQTITLTTALPSVHEPVTVTFAPGKPVTNTYLCSQPLLASKTLLNEGTPPMELSHVGGANREIVFGSTVNDPTDNLGSIDFITNDPYRTVEFTDPEQMLYEALETCQVDNGAVQNLITPFSDGPAPDQGFVQMELSGTMFSDSMSHMSDQGGSPFEQTVIFHVSGGNYVGGHIGPGTAVLYPNYPSIRGAGAINRATTFNLRLSSVVVDATVAPPTETVLEDIWGLQATADNVPPSLTGNPESNPAGAAGVAGHGACVALLIDEDSTGYTRVGPWGGLAALTLRSLLYGTSAVQPTGIPASGQGFRLVGGVALPAPTETPIAVVAAN